MSIALVSFVMNNRIESNGKQKYRVSETTKERILEVAQRLNYRPSSAARMLRQGRTKSIGVILSDMANIFYGTIAKELENRAYLHGYTVIFGSTEEDTERFAMLIQSFLEKDVEGFIVVPPAGGGKYLEKIAESGRPFVVIDRYNPEFPVPTVVTDNEKAMEMAIDALRAQGAKKIDMVSYAMRISSMTDREKSFRRILGPESKIFHLPFEDVKAGAEKVADEILARGTDGVITASNVPGVAILQALFRKGVKIQKDIKFVGFDYSNVYGLFDPPIPYILQPLPQIAAESAEYLFRLIDIQAHGEDIKGIKDRITLQATLL